MGENFDRLYCNLNSLKNLPELKFTQASWFENSVCYIF